jgi:signal transduction histidine kinase
MPQTKPASPSKPLQPPGLLNPAIFARSMLEADSFVAIARTVENLIRFRMPSAQIALLWSMKAEPVAARRLRCSPRRARAWVDPEQALRALAAGGRVQDEPGADGRVLRTEALAVGGTGQAVIQIRLTAEEIDRLDEDPAQDDGRLLLARRVSGLLEARRLKASIRRFERAERLQRALYAIADLANSEQEQHEVLREMHRIVDELIYARNFFIVLYDPNRKALRFPYFADTHDPDVPDPGRDFDEADLVGSLTVALLQRGTALMGSSMGLCKQLGLPIDDESGPDSEAWLGVPMRSDGQVRGAVVVQSYDASVRYKPSDRALLEYVAQHIQVALTRRHAREELERQVELRTDELGRANRELIAEVRERQAGERLQSALFRIAELTNTTANLRAFYASVHTEISELLYARNFYVALLDADGTAMDFPFAVDEYDPAEMFTRTTLRHGLTEYIFRTGKTLMVDTQVYRQLLASGEVDAVGTPAVSWLGVPLIMGDRVAGALVVQSYTEGIGYTARDQELLEFVAQNIATTLQRRQAADALKAAYAELQTHVEELRRTQAELIENEKMASLGRLVAGVAHEINTPLGIGVTAASHLDGIFSSIDRLRGDADSPQLRKVLESGRRCVQLVLNNLDKAAHLVRTFKQVAVDQSNEVRRRIAIRAFIDDVLASLHPRLKPTPHTVEVDCPAEIEFDTLPGALYQIVSNIILNALLHAFDATQVGLIRIRVGRIGDALEMTVADDGKGMPEEVRQRVFEPFFTTRRGTGGTGLGLHLVYNLVTQLLGGTIACASAPGHGTQFTIRLPLTAGGEAGLANVYDAVKE